MGSTNAGGVGAALKQIAHPRDQYVDFMLCERYLNVDTGGRVELRVPRIEDAVVLALGIVQRLIDRQRADAVGRAPAAARSGAVAHHYGKRIEQPGVGGGGLVGLGAGRGTALLCALPGARPRRFGCSRIRVDTKNPAGDGRLMP